jgi:hypothetical protein
LQAVTKLVRDNPGAFLATRYRQAKLRTGAQN